jgi:hypothetical protein
VRTSEHACPFCAGALDSARMRARPEVVTRGLSRASILALGASMAAATGGAALLDGCADEPDPDEDHSSTVPLYGAPVQPDAGVVRNDAGGGGGPGGATPVYGAPVQTDAGSNLPSKDAGAGVAIYGAPVQPDGGANVVPFYGAPVQPPRDAGRNDASASDAGQDASVWGDDGGRVGPVYGAPVTIYGAPIQPPVTED